MDYGLGILARCDGLKLKRLNDDLFLTNMQLSLHKMLIEGLKSCGLP